MTNIQLAPIATVPWSLHARLIPAYAYQQILTLLYFIHAFLPTQVQTYLNIASEATYSAYQTISQPLWKHNSMKLLLFFACLPIISCITIIALTTFALFWPLLVVGSTCSVISFTGALLMLNTEQISSHPIKQFGFYLASLIPLAALGYVFSPFLWCTLFLITAYHSITNPHFTSIPSLSTAGTRWLGIACAFLLISAPYWTIWHIISFPLTFFLSWMAQFWTFVGCVLVSKLAPHAVESVYQNYSQFVTKHSRPVGIEKDHTYIEKTSANGNAKETYERVSKIEHHN